MKPEDLGAYYESILDREVRRKQGIYYTPPLIVDYMVESTLGTLLKDKTPEEAAKIKTVDPACGAGVFLLGTYEKNFPHCGKMITMNVFHYANRVPLQFQPGACLPCFSLKGADGDGHVSANALRLTL